MSAEAKLAGVEELLEPLRQHLFRLRLYIVVFQAVVFALSIYLLYYRALFLFISNLVPLLILFLSVATAGVTYAYIPLRYSMNATVGKRGERPDS